VIETDAVSDPSDLEERIARHNERTQKAEEASVGEVIDFVKAYAKQETLGPLQGAGRWLGYGIGAAALLGVGLCFLLLGLLRVLQTEWERSASGNLSWLPYLITILVAVGLLVLTLMRIKKATLHKEPHKEPRAQGTGTRTS
jgi:hypothetical protein